MKPVFDLDVLRSFVTAVDCGSLAQAAVRSARSTSAMSAQMQRLEERVGSPIFRRQGRGLVLTEAGLRMASYARRLLELNDEAVISLREIRLGGSCRLGIQQDFCDSILSETLGRFARAHPMVQIEVNVVSNSELSALVASQSLDLAIAWDTGAFAGDQCWSLKLPIRWLAAVDARLPTPALGEVPVSLVMLGEECYFRSIATRALDEAGRSWRVTMTSPSLSGVWAGVEANLGLTTRTALGIPPTVRILDCPDELQCLPILPDIMVSAFMRRGTPEPAAEILSSLFHQAIEERLLRSPIPYDAVTRTP